MKSSFYSILLGATIALVGSYTLRYQKVREQQISNTLEKEVRYVFLNPRPSENVRSAFLRKLGSLGDPFLPLKEVPSDAIPGIGIVFTTPGHPYACNVVVSTRKNDKLISGSGYDEDHDGYFERIERNDNLSLTGTDLEELTGLLQDTRSGAQTSPDLVQIVSIEVESTL